MKTVSGEVLSSKPVSLSKAARVLSKFVASDNGASPAFAAYLRRASASFNELVQLRKEMKGSGGDHRGKKNHIPDGIVTEETVNSVKKHGHDGEAKLGVSERKKHKRDEVEVREIEADGSAGIRTEKQNSEVNVSRNVADIEAVDANGKRDDIDGKESKKKKKKRDKGERDESDSAVKKEEFSGNGNGTDVVENGVGERKTHKKNKKVKEEKESSSVGDAEQTDLSNKGSERSGVKTEGSEGKKKKQSDEEKEKESGIEVEIEEADKKESRKRKHKGSGHGGLDDSEEQHRSKKKSRKHEVDD